MTSHRIVCGLAHDGRARILITPAGIPIVTADADLIRAWADDLHALADELDAPPALEPAWTEPTLFEDQP